MRLIKRLDRDSLFDSVIEDFVLLCAWRENPVECKAVFLRARAHSGGAHLDGLEILMKGDDQLPSFALFYGICWSKSGGRSGGVVGWQGGGPYRHTTLMFVDAMVGRMKRVQTSWTIMIIMVVKSIIYKCLC